MASAAALATTQINEWVTDGRKVTESDVAILLDSLGGSDTPFVERQRVREKSTGKEGYWVSDMYANGVHFIGVGFDDGTMGIIHDPDELEDPRVS